MPEGPTVVRMPNTESPASRFHPNTVPDGSVPLSLSNSPSWPGALSDMESKDGDMEYMEMFYPGGHNDYSVP